MKYRAYLNPTIEQWQSNDPVLRKQLNATYIGLLVKHNLNAKDYKPVLGWDYMNDDFAKNRITLIIEAAVNPDTCQHDVTPSNYRNGSPMVCSKCGYEHSGRYIHN